MKGKRVRKSHLFLLAIVICMANLILFKSTAFADPDPNCNHVWENGVCTICGYECQHQAPENTYANMITAESKKASTCSEHGYVKYERRCSICNTTVCTLPLDQFAHNWNDGEDLSQMFGWASACGGLTIGYTCQDCQEMAIFLVPDHHHDFDSQSHKCINCDYYLPEGDGSPQSPYQLSSMLDLYWFADRVNSGHTSICAVLTCDITVNYNLLDHDGMLDKSNLYCEWIPIGSSLENAYCGTFDGGGYTISGLCCCNGRYDGVGLFGVVQNPVTIKNVTVFDSFFYGYDKPAGSIVGQWTGNINEIPDGSSIIFNYITHCSSNATVISQTCTGGIAGKLVCVSNDNNMGSTDASKISFDVTGCLFSGKVMSVNSDAAAGIVGSSGYTEYITNCVNVGSVSYVPTGDGSSSYYAGYGALYCIGTKNVGQYTQANCNYCSYAAQGPFGRRLTESQVYNGSACLIAGTHIHDPNFEACILCEEDRAIPSGSGTEDDPYLVECYDDLLWISNNATKACYIKLTNDIKVYNDFNDLDHLIFCDALNLPSGSVLDGEGHSISGICAEKEDGAGVERAIFDRVAYCTIKNVVFQDNYLHIYTNGYIGTEGYTPLPIFNRFTSTNTCINCAALGYADPNRSSYAQGTFTSPATYINCFSYEWGYTYSEATESYQYAYGTFFPMEGSANYYRLGPTDDGTQKTFQQFSSGEVCYLLNGDQTNIVFKQDLEAGDALPGFTGPQVYYGYSSCTATEPDYGNDPRYPEAGHDFVDGICTKCGSYNIEGDGTKANPYQLTNADQLYWFAAQVNEEGRNDICAILMDDIVVNNNVLDPTYKLNGTPARSWTPIGNNSEPTYDQVHYPSSYAGIFDGNGHFISGLYCKDPYLTYVGLFGLITESVIKNLTVKDSYFEGYDSVGGIVGAINDDGYSECAGVIRECHFNGVVKGNYEIGGICGNMNGPTSYRNNEGKAYTDTYLMYCLAEGKVICTRDDGNWVGGVLGGWFGGQLIDNHYEWHMAEDGSGTTQYGTGASSFGYTSEDEQGKTWPVSVNWAYANLICSPGNTLHEDFEDKNRVCHHCNLPMPSTMYSVAAYSRSDVSEASVANISINGNSQFYAGETVTLTAPDMNQEGYRFLGWFEVTTVNAGNVTAYGNKLSSNLAYSFTIAADTQCVAVYQPQGNVEVTISVVNGAKYYLSTDPNTIRSGSTVNVPLGSKLTISAEDDEKVLQWQNEAKKLLGSGADLTITVTSNMTITLVYKTVDDGQSFIQFVSDYGQVLSYDQYSSSSPIALPELPTKIGYTPICWVFEDGTTADNDSIRAKIGTDDIITLKPKYEATSETRTITVQYINTSDGDATVRAEEILTKDLGSAFTLTAPSIDSLDFSCWKDVSGTVLSYQKNYYLLVSADATVIACYVSQGTQQEEVLPVISLSDLYKVTSGETKKVSAIATRNIPEGYTLVEHGMLYARDFNAPTADNFTYEAGSTSGTGVSKYVATNSELNGTLTLNVKVDTEAVKVTFRGYMVLKNTATGNNEVFYTNIKSASYAEIQ